MGTYIIPTTPTPLDYQQRVELDGETFVLRFRYNPRIGGWLLDLFDADEAPLAVGRRLVADGFPLHPFRNATGMPGGQLFVHDTTADPRDPGLGDLGTRAIILYVEAADLA